MISIAEYDTIDYSLGCFISVLKAQVDSSIQLLPLFFLALYM